MGCQSSQTQKNLGIRINILDSNFLKQSNQTIKQKMNKLNIKYELYLSLSCLIQDMKKLYTNQIITSQQQLSNLKKQLKKLNFHPNIYVLSNKQKTLEIQCNNNDFIITYFKSYDKIIDQLTQKTLKKRFQSINPLYEKNIPKIGLKIFRKTDSLSSQQLIFQQTLKSKNISYQIYRNYNQFQQSFQKTSTNFIITDYVYHRQVIKFIQNNTNVRVICYCDLQKDQIYDSKIYFVTNNFLQIVSQIISQQKISHLNLVKCSKVYIYSTQQSYLASYIDTIQNFDIQVKLYDSLNKIINQCRYYFAITIIIDPQNRKQVQRYLQKINFIYKTKIVQIKKGTQNCVKGLRKTIKQLKKGYRAQKTLTKSIDIIDKHYDNVKFQSIKKQLEKFDIKFYGYNSLNQYIKNKKIVSSFIISNYQERSLVLRYIKQIKSKSKIILFCNKNNINSQLKQNSSYSYVSSHFGKILNFIKKNKVYNPCIVDQNDCKIAQKKQRLKKQNKRISALKWCQPHNLHASNKNEQQVANLQKQFQFINLQKSNKKQINEIIKQSSILLKLDYSLLNKKDKFIIDLKQSLRKIYLLFKIDFPQKQFQLLLQQIQNMNIKQLINKVKQFYSSQNQIGVKLNKVLIDIQKLTKQELNSIKQFLFLVNMNYLSVYNESSMIPIKSQHYLTCELIQNCQVGSFLYNKNYSIFYQNQNQQNDTQKLTKYKIQLQLQSNSLSQIYPEYNGYFQYKNKFIFSPYSEFFIKEIRKQSKITIIKVQYKKNVEFLNSYFNGILYDQKRNMLNIFQSQIQKQKLTDKSSFLFDQSNKDTFIKNFLRTKAKYHFQKGNLQDAIKIQKQIIIRQQNIQNFDSLKLQWLNYQLACFYFKVQNHTQCKKILNQVLQSQPHPYLKEKIKLINNFYKGLQKSNVQTQPINTPKSEQAFRTIVLEQTIAHYDSRVGKINQLSQNSEQSQEYNIFDQCDIQNEFPCLQIDKIQDFQEQQKENIY